MNKKRSCRRCGFSLSDMDPHSICKSCRQPDPQMFYCSEDDCEACSVIKVYKPLDVFLRKQEMENLAKKLNPVSQSKPERAPKPERIAKPKPERVPKPQRIVSGPQSKKKPELFNKGMRKTSSPSIQLEEKSDLGSDIMKSILKGISKEKVEPVNPSKSDISQPSTSKATAAASGDPENFKHLENRLFDRIMSTLMTSMGSEPTASSPDIPSRRGSPSLLPTSPVKNVGKIAQPKGMAPISPKDSIDLNKEEEELGGIIVELFSEIYPDALAKGLKEDDFAFKISSRACDILSKGTVLSAPSQAYKLCQDLGMESESSFWPSVLNASDLLHTSFSQQPSMKLHPKIRHMHALLFGKLNPTLPVELMGKNFTLPAISLELKNECLFAREQLQRLLLMFSMLDYFAGHHNVKENSSLSQLFELLLNLLKISIEKQANFVGLLIQEIRRDLLSDAECKEPSAVAKLIMGSVHQSQFFGPYVKELLNIVNRRGSSFCLTSKSECANVNVYKLPQKFREGESTVKFLSSLRYFFDSNSTKEKDKITILESLLPPATVSRLTDFVKPKTIAERSFDELAEILEKSDENHCLNYLMERRGFSQAKIIPGQSVQNFAEMLETWVPKCMFGTCTREMLRDQFVFGLLDEVVQQNLLKRFSWSFEECVAYAKTHEKESTVLESKPVINTEQPKKPSMKRKKEELEEEDFVKKVKQEDNKGVPDYYHTDSVLKAKSKTKFVAVNTLQQWTDLYGFDIKYTYDVYCPWTGQILRS